jgi:hypothetical protein
MQFCDSESATLSATHTVETNNIFGLLRFAWTSPRGDLDVCRATGELSSLLSSIIGNEVTK